jgi:hypothetical protein
MLPLIELIKQLGFLLLALFSHLMLSDLVTYLATSCEATSGEQNQHLPLSS